MKSFLCALIVFMIPVSFADAKAGTHGGGIKGGILISSPIGDREEYNVESINGLTYGAFYRYSFNNQFSSQTELIYAQKGSIGTYYSSDGQINITYLDLTSLVQYRLLNKNRVFGDIYIGPMASLRLDANVERESLGETESYGITSDIKPNDFGIVLGVKLGLLRGTNEYGIDLRYSSGFTTPDDTGADIELKNRTFTVMFEMYFGKGSEN